MAEKLTRGGGSSPTKNMVLRLDLDLAERLAGIAEVEGRSVSDVAREAIAALVEARRKDKRFRMELSEADYADVRRLGAEYRARKPRSVLA